MDISTYLEPVIKEDFTSGDRLSHKRLGYLINNYEPGQPFPDLENVRLAIIGVKEDRNAVNNPGSAAAPDHVRNYLYKLFQGSFRSGIADLGNIISGNRVTDTYFALSSVVSELLKSNIIPIIIGGSQDLTYANYMAYESLGQIINIVAVDSVFDLGNADDELNSQTYLSKIIVHQPNFLFNFTNIGYQSYFVDQDAVELMNNLFFDVNRLGKVRENIDEMEPVIRNADMLTFDISSVRQSDAPGNRNASPNGFYGEEICQIMKYAGLSDKLTSVGFYEINPQFDNQGQTAHLVAHMIWYFIEGFQNRKLEQPAREKEDFIKYMVSIKNHKDQIVFYKSKVSDRWWMDVPVRTNMMNVYERHHLIPCSYKDYETACRDDIPDRWWQAYQKLM